MLFPIGDNGPHLRLHFSINIKHIRLADTRKVALRSGALEEGMTPEEEAGAG
jgi:hypothetical protein